MSRARCSHDKHKQVAVGLAHSRASQVYSSPFCETWARIMRWPDDAGACSAVLSHLALRAENATPVELPAGVIVRNSSRTDASMPSRKNAGSFTIVSSAWVSTLSVQKLSPPESTAKANDERQSPAARWFPAHPSRSIIGYGRNPLFTIKLFGPNVSVHVPL